jgi:quinol monooxygenase YgiN
MTAAQSVARHATADTMPNAYVRLAELETDLAQLVRFKASVNEAIEASVCLEPGLLALFAMSLRDNLTQVRIFKMYTDAAAYAAHLETPHFMKFESLLLAGHSVPCVRREGKGEDRGRASSSGFGENDGKCNGERYAGP